MKNIINNSIAALEDVYCEAAIHLIQLDLIEGFTGCEGLEFEDLNPMDKGIVTMITGMSLKGLANAN